MDLNDDLCRADFYDFSPKLEPGTTTTGLTPVAYIDSVDYINVVTDSNNNLGNGSSGSSGTVMKSFLDDMLFSGSSSGNGLMSSSLSTNSSPSTSNGDDTEHVGLPSINSTFELLGALQWSSLSNGTLSDSIQSDINNTAAWLNSSENEVTTLTNLLDPLFVSYDPEELGSLNCGVENVNIIKPQFFTTSTTSNTSTTSSGETILGLSSSISTHPTMVSSDRISTTTFHNDITSKSYLSSGSGATILVNGASGDHELSWHKTNSPNSPFIYCDESLLRSALQTGKLDGSILQSGNINLNITTGKTSNNNSTMTELRKVLDYPPLSVNSDSSSTQSPTSTSTTSPTPSNILLDNQISTSLRQPSYFEFKILDPIFNSQVETIIIDESNIPNVEELIMTRIDNNKGTAKKMDNGSERKINSTTLSTKWTYATNNQSKAPKRRRTKQGAAGIGNIKLEHNHVVIDANNENSIISHNLENSLSPSENSNSNSHQATSRKERSLHYCNICNKGFKDKYSVNVHVRTHTGEKPFGCFCGKHFRQKAHLAKHHQTHAAKANGHQGKGKRATS